MAVFRTIALIMQAVNTSETSVNLYETIWRIGSEDSHINKKLCSLE
jgi:hypothetical protein